MVGEIAAEGKKQVLNKYFLCGELSTVGEGTRCFFHSYGRIGIREMQTKRSS